jgi:4a-hydroxytetrahydrobiopterin dehydratase
MLNQSPQEMRCQNSQTINKLSEADINNYLEKHLPNWHFDNINNLIVRKFEFKNFKQTMFFINAVAFICEKECHHPDAKFGYNYCEVNISTHDVGGVSINDIIIAAKIDTLL